MEKQEITVRIYGLSGNTIAGYAVRSFDCKDCKAKAGTPCKDTPANRACRYRFNHAINHLDNKASYAVMAELGEVAKPKPAVKVAHEPNTATFACPGCKAYPKITKEVLNEHYGQDIYESDGK